MALINCPECKREASDKVSNCPHCGYPFRKSKNYIKTIIILIISLIIIGGVSIGIYIYRNESIKKNKIVKELELKNNYLNNLSIVIEKMNSGIIISQEITAITHDVWYNAIFKKHSWRTDDYTTSSYGFNSDFNISLGNLSRDQNIIAKKSNIKNIQLEVDELMKLLINPPQDLENIYIDLDKIYRVFSSYTEIALNPSGSLSTFTSKINDYDAEYIQCYNKMKIYIK